MKKKLLKSKNESEMAEELSKRAEEDLARAREKSIYKEYCTHVHIHVQNVNISTIPADDVAAIEEAERKKKEAENVATKADILKKLTHAIEMRDITSIEKALAEAKKKKVGIYSL